VPFCYHDNVYRTSIFNEFKIPGLSKINMFQYPCLCLCFTRKSFAEKLLEAVMDAKLIVTGKCVEKFVVT
jgi:hypothetical protein